MRTRTDRYVVERGRDGSHLVIDRGPSRDQRTAIAREDDERAAADHAQTLSHLEAITSQLAQPAADEISRMAHDWHTSLDRDREHTFNHLLTDRPDHHEGKGRR